MTINAKFPKRQADGSFCIEVSIPVSTDDPEGLQRRVQSWSTQWVKANRTWKRNWLSRDEELHYDAEFKSEPKTVSCSTDELKIRLEGQPSATWWKDWMVSRILQDLKAAFSEVTGVGHLRDCE